MGVNVTDTSTERRFSPTVDGPAHSSLALPIKSNGPDGDLLAVLSIRKLNPEMKNAIGTHFLTIVKLFVAVPHRYSYILIVIDY